jgi:hypothetical protein
MVYPYFSREFTPYPIDTKKENDIIEVVPAEIAKKPEDKAYFLAIAAKQK